MDPAEFRATLERLGTSTDRIAADFDLPSLTVERWESGAKRIPRAVVVALRWRAALADQQAVLERSGLPECEAAALDAALAGLSGEAHVRGLDALATHVKGCPGCTEREAYLKRHAPPLPGLPMPLIARVWGKLPAWARPGDSGEREGVWGGLFIATMLSGLALGLFALVGVATLVRSGLSGGWWRGWLSGFALIVGGYYGGFLLAGLAYDALRPIRSRFIGHVLVGALCAAAIYGTIGLLMPFLDQSFAWADVPIVTGVMTVIGALAGAGYWIKKRLTSRATHAA